MKRVMILCLGSVFILVLLLAVNALFIPGATSDQPPPNVLAAGHNPGRTIVVNSTADSGPGTLRQALSDAQSGDTITFDPTAFPPAAPATIFLSAEDEDSALPNITQSHLTVDASNAGVILDGSQIAGNPVNGLEIFSDGNTIRGLQIVNFTGTGITLCGGSHNTIGGNREIGTGPLGQGNLASNNGIGIDLCALGSHNTVTGNKIGTDPTEIYVWGNKMEGIFIENGMTHNTIGPDNVIVHNGWFGVEIRGSQAFGNVVTQNSIHDNNSFGIRLRDGGNTLLEPPQISSFDVTAGTVTGTACADCAIEIFSDSSNEGEVYEGQTIANSTGTFTFNKGISFTRPHLTATATDADGNTSEFSLPTYALLQEGNVLPGSRLQRRQSGELEDNRIGILFNNLWHPSMRPEAFPGGILDASYILQLGVKRARLAINDLDWHSVDWTKPEFSIDPSHDDFITDLADSGMTTTFVLSFWDTDHVAQGGEIPIPRFKTEEEIQRYLGFVRFIVRHFKDRIEYYEIWNEPDITDTVQWIEVEDYINLVRRAVPVIRQEYPEAKIQVGGTSDFITPQSQDYLFAILRSDIMPLVDVVSWHPMYGASPEHDFTRQYYYEYPSLMEEIRDVASANGFEGEYEADELMWYTPKHMTPYNLLPHSETKCAKYYARGIVMHLGLDATVSQFNHSPEELQIIHTIQNLCTTLDGVQPASLRIQVQSTATNTLSYTFSYPTGAHLIALWTNGVAVDTDPGIPSTFTVPGLAEHSAVGIDVLHGFQQQLVTSGEDGNLVIRDLLIKDYPLILWLYEPKYVFLPSILKGAVVSEVDR